MKKSVEIEKKYIIKLPDLEALKKEPSYTESEIVQIYLEAKKGRTHRVRSRAADGATVYTETEKVRIDAMSAFEDEREIDRERFLELSGRMRAGSRPIAKRRITVGYGELLLEIDVYPEWKNTCIMEIELPCRELEVSIPPFIEVVEDVTGDAAYSNSSMSYSFPEERSI